MRRTHDEEGWYYSFIENLARGLIPSLYLEYGVDSGICIHKVSRWCKRSIGVDLEVPSIVSGYEFFRMDTQEFSDMVLPTLGHVEMAFIDADHYAESAYRDFISIYKHLSRDGIVILHDTYPESIEKTAPGYCGDSWRVPEMIRSTELSPSPEILTLPTPPGLTLVRKPCVPGPVWWMK